MALRGARILLAGACTPTGQSLVEAFLALGAQVIAADRLRTRLEELRAGLRQHERLWVAEADLSGPSAALALFADVARDEPIDAALLVVPGREPANSIPPPPEPSAASTQRGLLLHSESFLTAARDAMARRGGGRVLLLLEQDPDAGGGDAAALRTALQELVQRHADRAGSSGPAPAVAGLVAAAAHGALLERVAALCDPARPAAHGWQVDP